MKTLRNLSGIYFRSDMRGKKIENVVFEDLTEAEQDGILHKYTKEQLKRMCKMLANTINDIGEYTDIAKK